MALIFCPECGHTVSDKAERCAHCAYPIKEEKNKGKIQIKLCMVTGARFSSCQFATIYSGNQVVWNGEVGKTVTLKVNTPGFITVKYHMSAMHPCGSCCGYVDSDTFKKFVVQAKRGLFHTTLVLQAVDMFV